ncbi:MAG: hypothetical protein MUQ10_12265, partial [Anaerolineae bacterium]|nr:hypothetical protein [Anaerolineae bacterium]
TVSPRAKIVRQARQTLSTGTFVLFMLPTLVASLLPSVVPEGQPAPDLDSINLELIALAGAGASVSANGVFIAVNLVRFRRAPLDAPTTASILVMQTASSIDNRMHRL